MSDEMRREEMIEKRKPCRKLKYCPYGILVEQFPLPETDEEMEARCEFYGHICPAFCEHIIMNGVEG